MTTEREQTKATLIREADTSKVARPMTSYQNRVFKVRAKVWQISRQSAWREIEMIVDTGATYTTLPASFLESLGVKRVRKIRLTIANGRSVEREIGEVGIEINEKKASSTPVVFGDRGIYLLGSVTLEELSLPPDPVRKKMVPAEAYLLVAGPGLQWKT